MVRPQKISDAQIVAAARDALVEHGPGVTVARIAEKLEVSAAAVLKRVGSRDQLVARALAPTGPPAWLVRFDTPVTEAELADALVEVLSDAMSLFAQLVPLLILVRTANLDWATVLDHPRPPVDMVRIGMTRWIEASRGRPRRADPEPKAFVEAVLGAVESRCFHAYLDGQTMSRRARLTWIRGLVGGLWPRLTPTPD